MNPVTEEIDENIVTTGKEAQFYIMTFCWHYFHPQCIIKSMQLKSECPKCIRPHPKITREDLSKYISRQ